MPQLSELPIHNIFAIADSALQSPQPPIVNTASDHSSCPRNFGGESSVSPMWLLSRHNYVRQEKPTSSEYSIALHSATVLVYSN